ncbi:hypothetical protein C8Q75DRAFT_735988 [Abortiporus biennis]|nr:hypothetical protein C8Q75DRAFT_735988 [Abortiporus biennis]
MSIPEVLGASEDISRIDSHEDPLYIQIHLEAGDVLVVRPINISNAKLVGNGTTTGSVLTLVHHQHTRHTQEVSYSNLEICESDAILSLSKLQKIHLTRPPLVTAGNKFSASCWGGSRDTVTLTFRKHVALDPSE